MTRGVVFLAAVMVAASLGVVAQDISGGTPNSNPYDNSSTRNITATGCLNSSASGVYSLSDEHGITYSLSGNTSILRSHNAQQLEVTGKQGSTSSASSSTSATPTIQVTATKVIADRCNPSPVPRSNNETDGSAASSGNGAVNNGQLPQTSTILPLLGLIGLGSLVAGFFARH